MTVHLNVENLENSKDEFSLDNISLKISEGEIVLVGGKNGSGKTTLLETLCFVDAPEAGKLEYFGKCIFDGDERRKELQRIRPHLGVKFQGDKLFTNLTVLETLRLFSKNYGSGDLDRLISRCSLVKGILDKKVEELSEGEEQLTKFLLSIAHDPKLVLLDEPVSNLDEIAKDWVYEKMKELKSSGTSFLITLNELWKIGNISEKLIILEHGRRLDTIDGFSELKKGCVFKVSKGADLDGLNERDWILDIDKDQKYNKIYSRHATERTLEKLETPILNIREVKLRDFYPGEGRP